MSTEGCGSFVKILMFIFNLLLWIIGIACLGLGIYALVGNLNDLWKLGSDKLNGTQVHEAFEEIGKYLKLGAISVCVLGAFLFIVGFLGCFGAIKESKICLVLYAIILLVVLAVMGGISIYIIVQGEDGWNTIENQLKKALLEDVNRINKNLTAVAISTLQEQNITDGINCCGANNYTDYETKEEVQLKKLCPTEKEKTYKQKPGCASDVIRFAKSNTKLAGFIGVGFGSSLLFVIMAAFCLCCSFED